MKVSCGTDIIEIDRIKESLTNLGEAFKNRVYTKKEIDYCEGKKTAKYQHYAARFAAKEAVFKAVSDLLGCNQSLSWSDVEIFNDKNGRPKAQILNVKIDKIQNIDISISHCKQFAVANVVVMYE